MDRRRAGRGRGAPAVDEHSADTVHLPLSGSNAGCAPRQGFDHRQRDPDARGDHPGGGRLRYRRHFIEVCLDEADRVRFILRSGLHGAGRIISRNEAHRRFSVDGQPRATAHLGSRKDSEAISVIPMACKDIEAVRQARRGRVDVVGTRRQVVCVKG